MGGPQVRIILVAKELKNQVKTTVIMPNINSLVFQQKCQENEIPFKIFNLSKITKEWRIALRYLLFSPIEIKQLVTYFKNSDIDIIHVSGGSWQYKGIIAGKIAGKQVIWHLNDTSIPLILRLIFRCLNPLSDGFIYAANRAKIYYQVLVPANKPTFLIAPPVDTTFFSPGQHSSPKGISDKIIIGTIANINPIKGLESFLRAAAELNKQFSNLKFFIIGHVSSRQSTYFNKLKKLALHLKITNLQFAQECTDVRQHLDRFDIFVCSSLSETGPMTLFEAMAMKKPVVTTNVGDVSSYIINGKNGFIVNVGDSVAMARKIAILVEDKNMRKKFGERTRKIALQKLDIKKCAKKHFKAYTTIVQLKQ